MVGDREHDVIGARRRGLACIGVSYGYGSAGELRGSGAVDLAAHPNEIPNLVQRHIGVP
jgi:phosphoglycolate phosphatase